MPLSTRALLATHSYQDFLANVDILSARYANLLAGKFVDIGSLCLRMSAKAS